MGIVDFQTVLGHRGTAVTGGSDVYPMAEIGVARAFAASGDKANSVQAYRRFLELWRRGDVGQKLRVEAIAAVGR
jgi:serine/threonine-protein kinase